MRVLLISQNGPFYLPETIRELISRQNSDWEFIGAAISNGSPFDKSLSTMEKVRRTFFTFGLAFSLHYAVKLIVRKIFSKQSVEKILRDQGIPILKIEGSINDELFLKKIRELEPDVLLSIAGNQIFKQPLIDLAPLGCLNLHTALLPKYRGLMPTFWVLLNGEKHTGVSVFFVDAGIDSGPILVQKSVEIEDKSQQDLIVATKALGVEAVIEALQILANGKPFDLQPNDDAYSSYFGFPTRRDVKLFVARGKRFF